MLSIGRMGNGQATYYLGLAREDYYLEGGEPPGLWNGASAERLGLTGEVEREGFLRLFQGFTESGEKLVQNAGSDKRQPGWDLTFSAPKSVSTLWACVDSELRRLLQDAHLGAVKEALSYIEDEALFTRRGKDGVGREKVGMLSGLFEHGTSRAGDPQLHTHALVLNIGLREDGTTGTILSKPFYQAKMEAGALYRAELSHQLQEMGFQIRRDGTSFEIVGVPEQLQETFSKRRAEIEEVLKEKGQAGARASAVAALSTRTVKEHIAREELFKVWQLTGRAHGFGQEEIAALRERTAQDTPEKRLQETLNAAGERIGKEKSYFTERDLLRAAAEEAQGRGVWASLLRQAVKQEIGSNQDFVFLSEKDGTKYYTTREILQTEEELLKDVGDLQNTGRRHALDGATVKKAQEKIEREETVKARRESLIAPAFAFTREQSAALSHITEKAGAITALAGMAGTGKTQLLRAAREAWEAEGFTVLGGAIAGKAARGLQDGAGIESTTIAKILYDLDTGKRELTDRTVLVLDEAGMVGTRDMGRLTRAVHESGAKLVLVGDSRQLQPIDIGSPFRAIEERIGAARLTEIVRQKLDKNDKTPTWKRDAVKAFADGRAGEALTAFKERGFLHVSESRKNAMKELVATWHEKAGKTPSTSLIFAGTCEEVKELNQIAQDKRRPELGFRSVALASGKLFEKDRIVITKRDKYLGVENGDLGTVKKIDDGRGELHINLDRGETVTIPYRRFGEVSLGYAVTIHKGQGVTVDNAFVLCGGSMASREQSYVQASRARHGTEFFTEKLMVWDGEKGKRLDRTFEELSRRMGESKQNSMAVDMRAKRERAPVLELVPEM
jgi:Ti-type conjugative transfer relaxase TraA